MEISGNVGLIPLKQTSTSSYLKSYFLTYSDHGLIEFSVFSIIQTRNRQKNNVIKALLRYQSQQTQENTAIISRLLHFLFIVKKRYPNNIHVSTKMLNSSYKFLSVILTTIILLIVCKSICLSGQN